MHGKYADPTLPIYGQKVIGVRFGQLEMHGVKRLPCWTKMSATADKAATSITLIEAVDWVVGDVIVIASSDNEGRHAEKRTISAIDKSTPAAPVVTFVEPLLYKHFSAIGTYGTSANNGGDNTIDMRTEVGLLTRNIVFRGDPETSNKNMFGAHIMLHSPGDESVIGKIENVELTDVGQAF
jgi:hypothetical protein